MSITFSTCVQDVVYYIQKDGGVGSTIKIEPFYLSDGTVFDSFSSSIVTDSENINLIKGDHIRVTCDGPDTPSVTIELVKLVPGRRFPIKPHICPCCGSVLIPGRDGMNRCVNRGCAGQMYHTVMHFTRSLGLSAEACPSWGAVLNALLSSGVIGSPADIFRLNSNDRSLPELSDNDIVLYQRHTHLIRGHVSAGQLLKAMNIPNWMDTSYAEVDRIFASHNWSLLDIENLFTEAVASQYPKLDWASIMDFIRIGKNREIIISLAHILYQ